MFALVFKPHRPVCACAAIALIGALTACNSVDSGTSGANLSPNYERLASEAKKTSVEGCRNQAASGPHKRHAQHLLGHDIAQHRRYHDQRQYLQAG